MGIETSCEETAVAIVEAPGAGHRAVGQILANVIYSQLTEHRRFGGVVPEIAARAHLERIDGLVEEALATAGLDLADLDGIAATGGPGPLRGGGGAGRGAPGPGLCPRPPLPSRRHPHRAT